MDHLIKIMRSNKIESYKKDLQLSKLQRDVLVGTLLGDGCLETQNNGKTYRLKIEHSIQQKDYVDWKYFIFKDWVLTQPKIKRHLSFGQIRENYCFSTISHGSLRFYGQQFYKGKKVIPGLIKKLLTPQALAVWFMDDGSIKSNRHTGLIIHSQSFIQNDLKRVIDVFKNQYGVETILRKRKDGNGFILYITPKTVDIFINLIREYVLPSMEYKLGNKLPKE